MSTLAHGALLDALPDLVALVQRDGILLGHAGGLGVGQLQPAPDCVGRSIDGAWPAPIAAVIRQLVRRAIADRGTVEAEFTDADRGYVVRATAQSPERALCVIRAALATRAEERSGDGRVAAHLDRRGFLRRFKESMSVAALSERPTAVAMILVDGVAEIARVIDTRVAEQVMNAAIGRLAASDADGAAAGAPWYLGQLGDGLLVVVIETADRDPVERLVTRLCESLRQPVAVGDAVFNLAPYAGVAVLGQDAAAPKLLLDHARAAANDARRSGTPHVCFFSDTLRLRSLARLDIARELRDAIEQRDIRMRYVGRHDLATGRLVALVGYLRWVHPLRGEVRPAEFLTVAETTGLAASLSRSVLAGVRDDYGALRSGIDADVRISFGALRHHVLHEAFVADIDELLASGGIPAERLELRIAERAFAAREPSSLQALSRRGVHLVVDEVGRGMASLERLARAPLDGLQLDRSWVTALRHDAVALKVCRAGISMAAALGLTPIATGIDDAAQRDAVLELGCRQGLGDLYGPVVITSAAGGDRDQPAAATG